MNVGSGPRGRFPRGRFPCGRFPRSRFPRGRFLKPVRTPKKLTLERSLRFATLA